MSSDVPFTPPAAEETSAHQARQHRIVPVQQRARTDNPSGDPEGRRFALDQLFLKALAPGVRAERPGIFRPRRALVLALPRRARRPEDRETAHKDETGNPCGVHRAQEMSGRVDRVALMRFVAAAHFRRRVHDDPGARDRVGWNAVAEVRDDPLGHIRVLGVRRAADSPDAGERPRDLSAEKAARARHHGELRGAAGRRAGSGGPRLARRRFNLGRECFEEVRDAKQMLGLNRRGAARGHGAVERCDQLGESRVTGA